MQQANDEATALLRHARHIARSMRDEYSQLKSIAEDLERLGDHDIPTRAIRRFLTSKDEAFLMSWGILDDVSRDDAQ